MAGGKGGGSWKVAYADFVTAMMAFFLVMWIGAQDQKVRQSVANYFVDPSGVSKNPARAGSVMDTPVMGPVPHHDNTASGKGRHAHEDNGQPGTATKWMHDWIYSDTNRLKRWREVAQACRESSAQSPEVEKGVSARDLAETELSKQLQVHFKADAPKLEGIHQDLLLWSLSEVNWKAIAQELLES